MMKRISLILSLMTSVCLLISCNKENPAVIDTGYKHGAFITNEGAFGNSNGSVSYYKPDSAKMINHLFEQVNGRPLGDVVQSMSIYNDKGFIVVNNSQKMEVVDLTTFQSLGVIEGLEYPRYFISLTGKKGYLTDGNFAGKVYVIDTETIRITDTISCGMGPEHLLLYGKNLLVANSGGWGNDSTITVIDTRTDEVTATWQTGYNPTDLLLDRNNNLWVLCKGKVVWDGWTLAEETQSSLVQMDPDKGEILQTLPIGMTGDYYWPQSIGITDDLSAVYFLESGGLFKIDINQAVVPSSPLIASSFYGFGIEPGTGRIYGMACPSFTANGYLVRYLPDGSVIDSTEVGIGPNRIVFN